MKYQFADRIQSLAPSAIREILKVTQNPNVISFAAGNPGAESFPAREMNEISSALFAQSYSSALQYGISEGYAPLRTQIAERMRSKYATGTDSDDILIVSGGQQGIEMTAKIFCNDSETVVCEAPSFVGALNAFRSYGLRLQGIPVADDGIDTDALEAYLQQNRVRLLYVIPTFQNPSGVTMSLEKRRRLLALAKQYDFLILEDSPYFELRYSGSDVPTIKSLDDDGRVIFVGSFSKIIAPGIRIGFVIADRQIISKLTVAKQVSDVHTNLFFQMVVSEYLRRYDLDAHIRSICTLYRQKRDLMLAAAQRYFPDGVAVGRPDGGLFVWCTLPDGADSMKFCGMASEQLVAAVPGASFASDEKAISPSFRLNFSLPTDEQIDKGMQILGQVAGRYIAGLK